jgi:hypothetical protein
MRARRTSETRLVFHAPKDAGEDVHGGHEHHQQLQHLRKPRESASIHARAREGESGREIDMSITHSVSTCAPKKTNTQTLSARIRPGRAVEARASL